jgi:hypothetical protein
MKKELCERLVLECEQAGQKMGLDFYETMKKGPAIVERWKPFFVTAQEVWNNACNREDAIRYLLSSPEPDLEEFERLRSCAVCLIFCAVGCRKPPKVCRHLPKVARTD